MTERRKVIKYIKKLDPEQSGNQNQYDEQIVNIERYNEQIATHRFYDYQSVHRVRLPDVHRPARVRAPETTYKGNRRHGWFGRHTLIKGHRLIPRIW